MLSGWAQYYIARPAFGHAKCILTQEHENSNYKDAMRLGVRLSGDLANTEPWRGYKSADVLPEDYDSA
jgi:hypothetical protein